MSKREVGFLAHSSLTNHRITTQADEPFPESAFSQTTPALPDLVHLNPAPGKQDVAPPLLTLLQAYGELAAQKPEYVLPYNRVLDQLQQRQPNNALVQGALGRRCLQSGDLQEAIRHLKQSLAIGKPQTAVYSDLSEALDKLGQHEQGLAILQKAIQEDPFNPLLQRSLIFRLIALKQYANARAAMSRYSEIFPQDFFMRQKFAVAMEGTSTQWQTVTLYWPGNPLEQFGIWQIDVPDDTFAVSDGLATSYFHTEQYQEFVRRGQVLDHWPEREGNHIGFLCRVSFARVQRQVGHQIWN
jgi:tetratricopeptide (TPR) repeat protein